MTYNQRQIIKRLIDKANDQYILSMIDSDKKHLEYLKGLL